jgi:hypothetical protein
MVGPLPEIRTQGLLYLPSSVFFILVGKNLEDRLAGHVACMEAMRVAYRVFVGKSEGR